MIRFTNQKTLAVCAACLLAAIPYSYGKGQARMDAGTSHATSLSEDPVRLNKQQLKAEAEISGIRHSQPKQQAIDFLVSLPLEMELTADEFNLFTIIDANNDGQKWIYTSNMNAMRSASNSKADCDDWAILPGINFTNNANNYELAFDMFTNLAGESFHSDFEIYIGTAPDPSQLTTLIGKIDRFYAQKRNDPPTRQTFQFALPGAAGTYYIGLRCITTQDGYVAWINNLSLKEIDSSALAPALCNDAVATPGENGALTATVTFTMPTTAMNGQALDTNTDLTAIVASSVDSKTVIAKPGTPQSLTVATVQGNNEISLQVNGAAEGEKSLFQLYTGEVLPKRVHDLTAVLTRDNLSMTLTWTPPTEGENGGYVDFDNLQYEVWIQDAATKEFQFLESIGKGLTYTYSLSAEDQLRTVQLRILARSAAGVSTDVTNWADEDPVYVSVSLGKPYATPVVETFDNLNMRYTPISIQYPGDYRGRWYIGDPSEMLPDENQSALMAYNPFNEDATMGRVALPKISTLGMHNAAFSCTILKNSESTSQMDFYVRSYDIEEPVHLGSVTCNDANAWVDYSYPLPEQFQNVEWVQILVDVALDEVYYVYAIDKYSVGGTAEKDLAVSQITGPATAAVGEATAYTAEVYNVGMEDMNFTARFEAIADGATVATFDTQSTTIKSGARENMVWNYAPAYDQLGKEVTVRFTITTPDGVEANNTQQMSVKIRKPAAPVVADLSAKERDGAINLSWSKPDCAKSVTESFEELDDFYYGSEMGYFTAYDGDGISVYKFSNNPMPNEELAKAFMVVDAPSLAHSEDLEAHTGDHYLLATCPYDPKQTTQPAADDWLISEEIQGGSFFRFYMNIINEQYPETVRVMVSKTTSNVKEFTEIGRYTKNRHGWEEISYILPEDAKYVAINYISRDMFGILIDDVTVSTEAEQHDVTGYKIYRNGEYLAQVTEPAYVDTDVTIGNSYRYNVTTLFDNQESVYSNTVMLAATDIDQVKAQRSIVAVENGIAVKGYAGQTVTVYGAAGQTIFSGIAADEQFTIETNSGIYVIAAGTDHAKVFVK